jgi:predicted PhzF superfamily epimerase YddE/YHI9
VEREPGVAHRAAVRQGDGVRRPSRLFLDAAADRGIFVGGDVTPIGRGVLTL